MTTAESQAKTLRAMASMGTAYTTYTTRCPSCEILTHVMVPTLGAARWLEGTLIQDAMPELTPSQRELLISGLCDGCYPE